jgi:2-oxoglutarate ferredoxin oxidoreductase subunit gamma
MTLTAANKLYEGVIIAGFGGQGIILAGRLLAQTAMNAGREVTFIPAYGAEVRGGTSNCTVVIADEPIACPVIDKADTVIVMNKASFDKFEPQLKDKGLLIYNSSLIKDVPRFRQDIEVLGVAADEIAVGLGNQKAANMVMLGAYFQAKGLFGAEAASGALAEVLAERYHETIPLNTEALRAGVEAAAGRS